MNLHVPRSGVAGLVAFFAVSIAIFVYLMSRFGGPSLELSEPYGLEATFADTQGLAEKSDVLVRGVKVGEVSSIDSGGPRAAVRMAIESRYGPVGRGATVRIGQKTVLGEAYVDLARIDRGPDLADGSRIAPANVLPTVELDEALEALDERSLASVRSLLGTFARGARPEATSARFGDTVAGLTDLASELRGITADLDGQEREIASAVQDSRTVLREIGRRERAVTDIVEGGRATLAALNQREGSLEDGLAEFPLLMEEARGTLRDARPLLVEARPLLDDLRRASPRLAPALQDLRPVTRDLRSVLDGLPALRRAAAPTLDAALPVVRRARGLAPAFDIALGNLVTVSRYLEPRSDALAAWFANTDAIGQSGDAKGAWARFFIFMEPGTFFGEPGAFQENAYAEPGDHAHNRPYDPGSYPRLRKFEPPGGGG